MRLALGVAYDGTSYEGWQSQLSGLPLPAPTDASEQAYFADNHPMTSTLNADPAELAKFSDLAHRWWDLDG